jgi:hypothetical protein
MLAGAVLCCSLTESPSRDLAGAWACRCTPPGTCRAVAGDVPRVSWTVDRTMGGETRTAGGCGDRSIPRAHMRSVRFAPISTNSNCCGLANVEGPTAGAVVFFALGCFGFGLRLGCGAAAAPCCCCCCCCSSPAAKLRAERRSKWTHSSVACCEGVIAAAAAVTDDDKAACSASARLTSHQPGTP